MNNVNNSSNPSSCFTISASVSLQEVNVSSSCCTLSKKIDTEIESNISASELHYNLRERNKILQQQWYDAEQKCQSLLVENDKLNRQLSNEHRRADKYFEKLSLIEENRDVIERLKQLYIKSITTTTEKPKDIENMECQVTLPTTCEQCLKIEHLVQEFNDLKDTNEETIFIKRNELTIAMDLFEKLKDKVNEREKSWSLNMQRDRKYRNALLILYAKVKLLNHLLQAKTIELKNLKRAELDVEIIQKENQLFKKIIIKLEKRYKDAEKRYGFPKDNLILSEKETRLLQQIIKKHVTKFYKRRLQLSTTSRTNVTSSDVGSGDDGPVGETKKEEGNNSIPKSNVKESGSEISE